MGPGRRQLALGLLACTDLAVVAASFCLAAVLDRWDGTDGRSLLDASIRVRSVVALAANLVLWHLVLRRGGLYCSYRLSPVSRTVRDVARCAASAAPLVCLLMLLVQPARLRGVTFLVAFVLLASTGLVAERLAFRAASWVVRRRGRNLRYAAVVGEPARAVAAASSLAERDALGYRVVDLVDVDLGRLARAGDPTPVLARLERAFDRHPIDEVFVAVPFEAATQPLVRGLVALCDEAGVVVRVLADVGTSRRASADQLDGRPVVTIASARDDGPYLAAKRLIDVVTASAALVALAPLLLAVAIAIKLDSAGPVLFAQERVGRARRRFQTLKFRTMVHGAERLQPALEDRNEAAGPVFKIRHDPRVTRVGALLRRTSIDELPQLVNVLRGEMSLVGPRPLPVRDVRRIETRWHLRRFSVQPGITCLWQVRRREPEFDAWIRADMEYIDNRSLALDLAILVRTVPAVLSRQGAH